MGTRIELQGELLELAPYAYYQPPSNIKMAYPCFIYKRSAIDAKYADNIIYKACNCYTLTYISPKVADDKVDQIMRHFRYCSYDRPYTADGLHHYVFTIFY